MELPINYNKATVAERRKARECYILKQGYKCYYCGCPLNKDPSVEVLDSLIDWRLFPPNFEKYPIHLHHDHSTHLTLGAVHARCNAYLWQYCGE